MSLIYILVYNLGYSFQFTGKVVDGKTGMPIVEANISFENSSGIGTTTDESGIFSTDASKNSVKVIISAIGYKDQSHVIDVSSSDLLIFKLEQSTIELSPIQVIANNSRLVGSMQNFYRLPGSVGLISKSEVKEFNDTDINKIISQVPGVYTRGRWLWFETQYRNARNWSRKICKDKYDGRWYSYCPGSIFFSCSILFTYGRKDGIFEIRKGSSQIKYGPHSTGGAINYVSASIPQQLDFSGAISLGQHTHRLAQFKTGISSKNIGLLFQTHLDDVGGFKQIDGGGETGYDKKDFLFKARVNNNSEGAALELKISRTEELSHETYLGLTFSDFSENPLRRYSASKNDKMEANHDQITLTGVVKVSSNTDLTSTIYNNDFHRNWYKLNKVDGFSIGSILDQIEGTESALALLSAQNSDDNTYDIKANNRVYNSNGIQTVLRSKFSFFKANHNLMAGFRHHSDEMDRYQWSDLYKMKDGSLMMTTAGIRGEGSKNNRLYSANANSIFIEDEIQINNLSVTIGIRQEDISLQRNDWGEDLDRDSTAASIKKASMDVFVPGLGISYQFLNGLQVFSGIHNGFSPPGPGINDDDDILPEESINFEIGGRFNRGFQNIEVISFYNDYKNLLGEDTEAAGSGTYAQFNGGKVLIRGLELSYTNLLKFNRYLFPISLSYTHTDARFKNSFDSEFDPWGNVSIDDELPYIPKNMLQVKFGFKKDKVRSYVRYKYSDATRVVAGQEKLNVLNSTDQLNIFDFVTRYQLNQNISIDLKINNILDSKAIVSLRPAGYRPTMPRQIITSIIFDF